MHDEAAKESKPLDSQVRFSLRGMLIATAVAAACLIAVAPRFHQWNAEQRKAFLLVLGHLTAGAGAGIVMACGSRLRAERHAGAVRYRLPAREPKLADLSPPMLVLAMVIVRAVLAVWSDDAPQAHQIPDLPTLMLGFVFASLLLRIWWGTECVELCDGGVLTNGVLLSWQSIRSFRWGASNPNLSNSRHEQMRRFRPETSRAGRPPRSSVGPWQLRAGPEA